jgi:DNA-binding response OmpR family regulator
VNKKIFLVDDDKNIRSLLTTLLEIEGFEVIKNLELSVDGVLQTVKSEGPDLVLLDVHLKGVDGIEILNAIRSDPSLDQIQVIMSSGMDLRRTCMDAGANGFLMKPYMPAELLEIIK